MVETKTVVLNGKKITVEILYVGKNGIYKPAMVNVKNN